MTGIFWKNEIKNVFECYLHRKNGKSEIIHDEKINRIKLNNFKNTSISLSLSKKKLAGYVT